MPIVTPTLNLPTSAAASSASSKTAPPPPASAPGVSNAGQARMPDGPSATVTLSPQAMNALASSGHPSGTAASTSATDAAPAPAAHDGSVYDALKGGISSAVTGVGDAIAGGAHAVVDGVETTLSTANKVATGLLELPFAAVAKACDAVGGLIDDL